MSMTEFEVGDLPVTAHLELGVTGDNGFTFSEDAF
jgi:hypothetical protein